MKYLNAFTNFDLVDFLLGKELTVTACTTWVDFNTGAVQGTKIEVAITRDDTPYPPAKDGSVSTNLYEKMTVKIPRAITVPTGAIVTIVNGIGNVYGEYRNQLSIRAEDVKVITPPAPPAKGSEKAA